MNAWTKEQLEEMFGDDVVEQLAFLAGCTKHSYSDPKNPELDGFIISQATLDKFAELIVRECVDKIRLTTPSESFCDFVDGIIWGFKSSETVIKEHFGVEL